MKIATFNVNTIRMDDQKGKLTYLANKHQIEIIGIQEHRIIDNDDIEYKKVGDHHHLITSSAWRNNAQASQGGVGLLLGAKVRKALLKVNKVHPRTLLVAEFTGNPKSTVIALTKQKFCTGK